MSQNSAPRKVIARRIHEITVDNDIMQSNSETVTHDKERDEKERIPKKRIPKSKDTITVCVSSRALFNMEEERKIYLKQGLSAYLEYMIKNEKKPLKPGSAFPFVRALNAINMELLKLNRSEKNLFDVVLMSKNSAQVGIALINSINHHKLRVERICLTAGRSVVGYLEAYQTDLYLSVEIASVEKALSRGIASAVVYATSNSKKECSQLRVAFDGDSVLFSDEAASAAKKNGFKKMLEYESKNAHIPLDDGPLRKFAMILGKVKKKFHAKGMIEDCPIRTYLVTARSGASSGERALYTLREWGLDMDEALFLAGADKGPILQKIQPHLFFDDKMRNINNAVKHGVPSAHVPRIPTHNDSKK